MTDIQAIDRAFDQLNSILDASGALDAAATQKAAYALRLAIVTALGDPDRIKAAQAMVGELAQADTAALPAVPKVGTSWGVQDLDFLDDDEATEDLSDEDLQSLKVEVLNWCGPGLTDALSSRGNEYVGQWWEENKAAMIAKVKPAGDDDAVEEVVDYLMDLGKKYGFNQDRDSIRGGIEEAMDILNAELTEEQIAKACDLVLERQGHHHRDRG